LNEEVVERQFLPKLRKVAARLPFATELLSVWYCARDKDTPLRVKGILLAALAYFVLPVDAIPDIIAGLGFTDDAAVIATVIALVGRSIRPRHKDAAKAALARLAGESESPIS